MEENDVREGGFEQEVANKPAQVTDPVAGGLPEDGLPEDSAADSPSPTDHFTPTAAESTADASPANLTPAPAIPDAPSPDASSPDAPSLEADLVSPSFASPSQAVEDLWPGDTLATALERHKIELPPEQLASLGRYVEALWEWNEKINLTRHTTFEKFVSRDVVDSLAFSRQLAVNDQVLDVGAGGGVPGFIMAMVRPDAHVALIDSVQKKFRVLEDVAARLELDVDIFHGRVEEHLTEWAYETLTARAVAPLPKLLGWLRGRWGSFRRLLAMKGPAWKDEFAAAEQQGLTQRLKVRTIETYPLPGASGESVLLEFTPISSRKLP